MDKETFDAHLLAVLREHTYFCKAELMILLDERFEKKRRLTAYLEETSMYKRQRFGPSKPYTITASRLYTTLLEFGQRGIVENRWRVPPNDPHDRKEVLEWRLTEHGVHVRRVERRKPARVPA